VRKVAVATAGFSVLTVGVALIVLPGPAVIVIPIGLAILAKEFTWARRVLTWSTARATHAWTRLRRSKTIKRPRVWR
jgi:uncharacterized protein (TIGR02611 family)